MGKLNWFGIVKLDEQITDTTGKGVFVGILYIYLDEYDFFAQLPTLPYYAIITVVFGVMIFFFGRFSGVFLFEVGLSTPPAANGDLWRLPPVKIFYFYFFLIFLYQNQLVGVNGLLGTLVLGGCYN